MDIIFWNFVTFSKNLSSPQVKRRLISSIKNIVYELPHELWNNLGLPLGGLCANTRKKRPKILGNQEILGKY